MNHRKNQASDGNGRAAERVAIVTGARIGGISFAVILRLLLAGFAVVMGDRDKAAGMAAAKRLRKNGFNKVWFSHTDFSDELQVGAMMDWIQQKFGKLNLLVNTCGSACSPLDDNLAGLTPTGLRRLFDDNVMTFYNMTRAAVTRFMQHQEAGGVVIALSTNNGILGIRGQMAYGAMKQTLVSFCRSLTVAHASSRMRFVTVTPGVVVTNSLNWQRRLKANPDWVEVEGSLNPVGRMLTPDDVAKVVVDISGDHWQMVTGTEIVVDGGERAAGGDVFQAIDFTDYRQSAVALEKGLRDLCAVASVG